MPPSKVETSHAFQYFKYADLDLTSTTSSTSSMQNLKSVTTSSTSCMSSLPGLQEVKREPSKAEIKQSLEYWKHSDFDHTFKHSQGIYSNQDKHAPSKPDIWRSFQYFKHVDIDLTFKRSPGLCADAVKYPPDLRVSRKRPKSEPPELSAVERTWNFYHRQDHTNSFNKAAKRGGRSAAETSFDKVSASLACDMFKCHGFEERPITRRSPGQFSPSTGTAPLPRSKSLHVHDFYSGGLLEMDSNIECDEQRRAGEVTFDKAQHFSEQSGFQLKQDIASLTETKVQSDLPEYVQEMKSLGIEHRRLATSISREQRAQEGQPFNVLGSPRPGHSITVSSSWQDLRKGQDSFNTGQPSCSPRRKTRDMARELSRGRLSTRTPLKPALDKRDLAARTPRTMAFDLMKQQSVLHARRCAASSPHQKVKMQDSSCRLSSWMSEFQQDMDDANVNSKRLARALSRGSLQHRSQKQDRHVIDELSKSAPAWSVDHAALAKMMMLQKQEGKTKKIAEKEKLAREAQRAKEGQCCTNIDEDDIVDDDRGSDEEPDAAKGQSCRNRYGEGVKEKHDELLKSKGSLDEENAAAAGQSRNNIHRNGVVQYLQLTKSENANVDEDGVVHIPCKCETTKFPKLSFYLFGSSLRSAGSSSELSERSTADLEEGSTYNRSSTGSTCCSDRTSQPHTAR